MPEKNAGIEIAKLGGENVLEQLKKTLHAHPHIVVEVTRWAGEPGTTGATGRNVRNPAVLVTLKGLELANEVPNEPAKPKLGTSLLPNLNNVGVKKQIVPNQQQITGLGHTQTLGSPRHHQPCPEHLTLLQRQK